MADLSHIADLAGAPVAESSFDLDQRLAQLENGLRHIEAILPAMVREVQSVRGGLKRAA